MWRYATVAQVFPDKRCTFEGKACSDYAAAICGCLPRRRYNHECTFLAASFCWEYPRYAAISCRYSLTPAAIMLRFLHYSCGMAASYVTTCCTAMLAAAAAGQRAVEIHAYTSALLV